MWILALLLPAHACEPPTRTPDVVEAAGRVDLAWSAMDAEALTTAMDETRHDLGCLEEPLNVDGAAAYHRAEALSAFLTGDPPRAAAHFSAVRELLPAWQLPSSMAPAGHPLRAVFDGAVPGTGTVPLVVGGPVAWYQVDGTRRDEAPTWRPYVLQRFGSDGAVLDTALATGAQAVPEPLPGELPPEPPPRSPHKTTRIALGITAGALAAGAGVAVGLSAHAHDQYWDPTTDPYPLPQLRRTVNTGTSVGIGLGAAALGCATAAVFVGRF